jgi:hypothetical protein
VIAFVKLDADFRGGVQEAELPAYFPRPAPLLPPSDVRWFYLITASSDFHCGESLLTAPILVCALSAAQTIKASGTTNINPNSDLPNNAP